MATSNIKTQTARGTGTPNQKGASCIYERIGNVVTLNAVITHEAQSWTIIGGLPPAIEEPTCIGVLGNGTTGLVYPVYMTINGTLQVRSAPFTETYNFSGSYLCE